MTASPKQKPGAGNPAGLLGFAPASPRRTASSAVRSRTRRTQPPCIRYVQAAELCFPSAKDRPADAVPATHLGSRNPGFPLPQHRKNFSRTSNASYPDPNQMMDSVHLRRSVRGSGHAGKTLPCGDHGSRRTHRPASHPIVGHNAAPAAERCAERVSEFTRATRGAVF